MKRHSIYRIICMIVITLAAGLLVFYAAQAADLRLPTDLKRIEERAFYGDTSLNAVIVPDGTEVIGSEAFAHSGVKTVTLPGSLYSIADNAFDGCDNLAVNAQEGTYAYAWAVKNKFITIDGGGEGETTKVVVPETLRAGMNLEVQLFGPSDTIHHSVYIVNEQTGEYQYKDLTKAVTIATFMGYNFDPGYTYRMTIYTVTRQYQTLTPVVKTIQVSGQKTDAPLLEIPETLKIGQEYEIEQIGYDRSCMKMEYYSSDGELFNTGESWGWIDTYLFDEEKGGGTIKISYTIYTNGLWSKWAEHTILVVPNQYITNVINFPDLIENGQDFNFCFEYEGRIDNYEYSMVLEGSGYSDIYGCYQLRNGSGTEYVYMSTENLQQGRYNFYIHIKPEDYGSYVLAYRKTIEVIGDRTDAPSVTMESDDVYEGSSSVFTISSSESDMVAMKHGYPREDDGSYTNKRNVYGKTTRWEVDFYEPGVHTFSFAVRKNGKWSAWSAPIEVRVKERDKLSSPNIHINNPINAGEDLTFTFDKVDFATHYIVNLLSGYSDTKLYSLDTATPVSQNTIPGYLLSSDIYVIEVIASAEGYESSNQKKYITVSGTRPAAPVVSVNETPRGNKTVVFSVDTNDAEIMHVKYRYAAPDRGWSEQNKSIPVTDEVTQWAYQIESYSIDVEFTVSFSVKSGGIWSDWTTNTYMIERQLPPDPAVIHVDDMIEAGKDFVVTIDPVPNATHYYCEINEPEGSSRWWNSYYDGIGEIHIAGYTLDPGEYVMRVYSYSDNYFSSVSEKIIKVIGEKPSAPHVSVDRTEINQNESVTFTIGTEGADGVYIKNKQFVTSQGEATHWTTQLYSGSQTYSFTVLIDGKWSAWSEPISINVHIQERPVLDAPVVYANKTVNAGSDYSFSFDPVANATSYSASLASIYSSSTIYSWGADNASPDTVLSVPGYILFAGSYYIDISASANGYTSSTTRVYFTADGNRPTSPNISVTEPLRIRSIAYFRINTKNADALVVKYQYKTPSNWWSEQVVNVPVTGEITQWAHQINPYYLGANLTVSFSVRSGGIWSAWKTKTYTIEGEAPTPATPTDLPATPTDLPATPTDLPATPTDL